jgi:hypothetical protein
LECEKKQALASALRNADEAEIDDDDIEAEIDDSAGRGLSSSRLGGGAIVF